VVRLRGRTRTHGSDDEQAQAAGKGFKWNVENQHRTPPTLTAPKRLPEEHVNHIVMECPAAGLPGIAAEAAHEKRNVITDNFLSR
jgi:hypothetical protein